MEINEIVMKLIGPVQPVGESGADKNRLENLEQLILLSDFIIDEIITAAQDKDRPEASMKAIGERAERYLESTKDWIEDR